MPKSRFANAKDANHNNPQWGHSIFEFQVSGTPKPQERPRARVIQRPGKGPFAQIYSPKSDWKKLVFQSAKQQPKLTSGMPLKIFLEFSYHWPKSMYRSGKNSHLLKDCAPSHHTKKPDCDNLAKAVMDAIVDAEMITDDSIIVELVVRKKYIEKNLTEGCFIRITEVHA